LQAVEQLGGNGLRNGRDVQSECAKKKEQSEAKTASSQSQVKFL
jgi:hypothetical protein